MSNLTKSKLMKGIAIDTDYRAKSPSLAKIAGDITNSLLIDHNQDREIGYRLTTADQLDLSKVKLDDFILVTAVPEGDEGSSRIQQRIHNLKSMVLVRLMRLDDHRFRVFYYYRQSDHTTYMMVYSAIIDDRLPGLVGDVDLSSKMVVREDGFHPGLISVFTFETVLNFVHDIGTYGTSVYKTAVESFAFKKKVPANQRHLYSHYQIN